MFQNNYINLANAPASSPSSESHQWDSPTSWLFPLGVPDALLPYDPVGQNVPLPTPLTGEMTDAYLQRIVFSADNIPTGLTYWLTDDSEPLSHTPASDALSQLRRCIRYTLHPEQAPPKEILDPTNPEYNDGDYKLVGGSDQLLRYIVGNVPVMLNTAVEEVTYTSNGVELQTSKGDMFREAGDLRGAGRSDEASRDYLLSGPPEREVGGFRRLHLSQHLQVHPRVQGQGVHAERYGQLGLRRVDGYVPDDALEHVYRSAGLQGPGDRRMGDR